ncbi:single-stranded DNA-binding protein [Corynebacterium wankanglinii]|nr:single-stranded DNA-binding protein [Corynebacterium wankanglinii]
MANIDYTVIGNLTAEPFFKRFDSGSTVLRFRVATSDTRKVDNNGKEEWEDFNQFYVDVECWGLWRSTPERRYARDSRSLS